LEYCGPAFFTQEQTVDAVYHQFGVRFRSLMPDPMLKGGAQHQQESTAGKLEPGVSRASSFFMGEVLLVCVRYIDIFMYKAHLPGLILSAPKKTG
jgi:hypothetical protein